MSLERRAPLERRTRLKPGKPLERGKGPRRDGPGARRFAASRSTLPAVSDRRRREQAERRRRVLERYGPTPRCYVGETWAQAARLFVWAPHVRRALDAHACSGRADDGHEVLTRGRGGSIVDPDNVTPACRRCHDLIGHLSAVADLLGLTRPSWS